VVDTPQDRETLEVLTQVQLTLLILLQVEEGLALQGAILLHLPLMVMVVLD
jgi:hypothetical protein